MTRLLLPGDRTIAGDVLWLPDGSPRRVPPPIPATLCHLDVDKGGCAVPWASHPDPDTRDRRRREALVDLLCGVCGFDLPYRDKTWLVAAPDADTARAARDTVVPGAHPACADYVTVAFPPDTTVWLYRCRGTKLRHHPLRLRIAPADRIDPVT